MSEDNGTAVRRDEQRAQVMRGSLPDDFLRINTGAGTYSAQNVNQSVFAGYQQPTGGVLSVTIVQARLAKNYGYLTRMDPYCRVRVGIQVYETPTAYNGAKTPRWNKLIHCQLAKKVKDIHVEIFDECTFAVDERIAWGLVPIPESVYNGEVMDEWFSLSGKQGDEKEGMVELVLQYTKNTGNPYFMPPMAAPVMMNPVMQPVIYPHTFGSYGQPLYTQQQVTSVPPAPQTVNEQDLKNLQEMSPEMDEEIIRSVLQQSGGNVDQAAARILEMNAN